MLVRDRLRNCSDARIESTNTSRESVVLFSRCSNALRKIYDIPRFLSTLKWGDPFAVFLITFVPSIPLYILSLAVFDSTATV